MANPKNNRPEPIGIPMDITLFNPKRKSSHKAPCVFPLDILEMDKETFDKSYGPHILQAVFELIQHPSFRQSLAKPKLVITP